MNLKARALSLAAIGFALGVIIGVFITAVTATNSIADGTLYVCAPEFNAYIGSPLRAFVIEAVLSGVYGAIGMGGSVVYSIENWSVLKATLVHFAFTVAAYYATAFYLMWISPSNSKDCLIMLIIFVIPYFMIWMGQYLAYRVQIEKINRELGIIRQNQREKGSGS